MAINFITGLPRAGKTLWAIEHVKKLAEKDKRQVYTCNIPEVTLEGWLEIDHPDKWMEVPNNSIILIDELQDFWNNTGTNVRPPLPILELSKHGKRGIDFFIITQEPELVHKTPRLLCQFHYFVVRAFGSNNAMVHKFNRMQTHPEKVKKGSEKIPWRYPKEAFGRQDKETGIWLVKPWYKSADVHNVKRQIPLKVFAIPLAVVFAICMIVAGVFVFKSIVGKASGGAEIAKGAAPGADAVARAAAPAPGGVRPGQTPQSGPATPQQYLDSYTPRVAGFQHTAPAYDGLTSPASVPVPAACIESKSKGCKCYTQQGTPYPVTLEVCRDVVAGGLFLAFEPSPGQVAKQDRQIERQDRKESAELAALQARLAHQATAAPEPAQRPVLVAAAAPAAPTPESAPPVVVVRRR